jgi:hypothetical protein
MEPDRKTERGLRPVLESVFFWRLDLEWQGQVTRHVAATRSKRTVVKTMIVAPTRTFFEPVCP